MNDSSHEPVEGEYSAPRKTGGIDETRDLAKSFWGTANGREKAVIVLGVLYALSPVDLIPEVLLGPLGLLDDGGAIFVVLLTVLGVLKRQKHTRSQAARIQQGQ